MHSPLRKQLAKLGPSQRSVAWPRRGVPLHAMLTSCGHQRVDSPAYDWHGLRRGESEFVVFQHTLAGHGRLRYESRDHELATGQAMLVRIPHDHRYFLPPESPAWEFLYICLAGREVMRLVREVVARLGPVFPVAESSPVLAVAAETIERAASGCLTSPCQASDLAYRLAMALLELAEGNDSGRQPVPTAIGRVLEYCRSHLHEPLAIDDLANVAKCSRSHFSRQFRRCQQMTPVEFLTDLRIREAARLLRETELTLKEIAPRCGFPDGNYLCKVFRRSFGLTPGAFRKTGMY